MDAVTSPDFPPAPAFRRAARALALAALPALVACGGAPGSSAATDPSRSEPTTGGPAAVTTVEHPAAPPRVAGPGDPRPAPDLLARRELPLGGRPLGLAAGDLDGDGFEDLVAVTESPGVLHLLRGGPDGLTPAGQVPIGSFPARPVLVPDPAGGLGVLVASKATRRLTAFRIAPDGERLTTTTAWETELAGVPRVLHPAGPRSLFWLARDGRIERLDWPSAGSHLTAPPAPGAALPLDRDARPIELLPLAGGGLLVLCQGDRSLRLVDTTLDAPGAPGDPAGADLVEVGRLPFDGVPRSAVEADLDGDGDLEQAVFGGDRRVLVFGLGTPAGDLVHDPGSPAALEQPNLVPMAGNAADLDGDGTDELVALGHLDQGYSVLGGFAPLPDGRWHAGVAVSEYAGQDPWDLALGDFDGDGRVDLASACRGAAALSVLSGSGLVKPGKPAFHQAGRIGVGTNPLSIAEVDTSGDGRPEVATLDAADGRLSLLANDGYGTLTLAARLPVGPAPRGLTPLRVGEASTLVALVVPAGSAGRLVALGTGADGSFGALEVGTPAGAALGDLPPADEAGIAHGDWDGDGREDLFLLGPDGGVVVLLGRALAPGRLTVERGPTLDLRDVVGAAGLAFVRRPEGPRLAVGGRDVVALVGPDGTRTEVLARPASQPDGRGVARLAAGDLDGDGHDDLAALWLGAQGTSPGVLATRTLGPDAGATFELSTGLAPADLVLGDLNGDGLAEAVVAAQNSHLVQLWVNVGSGGFAVAPAIGAGLGPLDLCLTDLIGKDLPDLLVANAFSADVSRVLNRPRP